MDRAQRDGLRGVDAFLRALELLTIERGSPAAKAQLADVRAVLEGRMTGFSVPDIERVLARERVDRLESRSHAQRVKRIRTSGRDLRGAAFCEALLERARAALPSDPRESGSWAECAVRAATYSRTDEARESAHLASCLARGHAFWGNSLRILCDLRNARRQLDHAGDLIQFHAIGDLATRAEVASFRGSLLRAQREFEEAIRVLEVSAAGWDLLGNRRQQALTLLTASGAFSAWGDPNKALDAVVTGRALLDTPADPRVALSFRHNEAWFLEEVGRLEESRRAAEEARALAAQFPDSFTQLRLQWLEGRLCRSEGRSDDAIAHFRTVQDAFLAEQNPYDAALVSLDLAALYLQAGRHSEVADLATAMAAAFESLGVHREALAAWRLFADACQRQAASVGFAKNLARYLDQARHDPEFGFAASGVWG
jgi:tetratricopeptide (TPR) repeat protein